MSPIAESPTIVEIKVNRTKISIELCYFPAQTNYTMKRFRSYPHDFVQTLDQNRDYAANPGWRRLPGTALVEWINGHLSQD